MKILFLSQRFLLPMDTGGKIRTGKILEQISKKHIVTLISNVEYPKDEPYLPQIVNLCTKFIGIPWKEIKKYSLRFWIRLFFQLFSKYPAVAMNDYSRPLRNAVEKEAEKGNYDVAICDFVQSALLFKRVSSLPKILFEHNVESIIAERHFQRANNFFAKGFWWLQWKRMFAYEKNQCHFFNTIIAVSKEDKMLFDNLYNAKNIKIIPTGVDLDYYSKQPWINEKANSLVFCGSMDWLPNEDAIIFFMEDILPLVKKKISDITLTVVGRNPSTKLKKKVLMHPEVKLTGWVADTRPYIARCALFIVPMRIGGGTRMKIFETMAMQKPVLSTTIGAEGLPIDKNDHFVIADSPEQFSHKIIDLLTNPNLKGTVAERGYTYVHNNFSWQNAAAKFLAICRTTLNRDIQITKNA